MHASSIIIHVLMVVMNEYLTCRAAYQWQPDAGNDLIYVYLLIKFCHMEMQWDYFKAEYSEWVNGELDVFGVQ